MIPSLLIHVELPGLGNFQLKDEEALLHIKAMRLREGEEILFLDGAGHTLRARKAGQGFDGLELGKVPALSPRIELYLSPPKGDALWDAVTQATEMGAAKLCFLRSEHNQHAKIVHPPAARAQRVADAACSQCARAWRLDIEPAWQELEASLDAQSVVADEALANTATSPILPHATIKLFIGPEGGWSTNERRLFDVKGARRLSLGPLILRVPTACVAAINTLRLMDARRSAT